MSLQDALSLREKYTANKSAGNPGVSGSGLDAAIGLREQYVREKDRKMTDSSLGYGQNVDKAVDSVIAEVQPMQEQQKELSWWDKYREWTQSTGMKIANALYVGEKSPTQQIRKAWAEGLPAVGEFAEEGKLGEALGQTGKDMLTGLKEGVKTFGLNVLKVGPVVLTAVAEQFDDDKENYLGGKRPLWMTKSANAVAEYNRELIRLVDEDIQKRVQAMGITEETSMFEPQKFTHGLMSGISSLATAIGVTAITKNPTAGAYTLGVVEGSDTYIHARDKLIADGMDEDKAEGRALALATVEVVGIAKLEKLGIEALFRSYDGGLHRKMAFNALTETGQETAQTVWSNMVAKYGYDETVGIFDDTWETVIQTLPIGYLGGGFTGAVGMDQAISPDVQLTATGRDIAAKVADEHKVEPEEAQEAVDELMGQMEKQIEQYPETIQQQEEGVQALKSDIGRQLKERSREEVRDDLVENEATPDIDREKADDLIDEALKQTGALDNELFDAIAQAESAVTGREAAQEAPQQEKKADVVKDTIEGQKYFRGGGKGSMPSNLTAQDIIKYEQDELGNKIKIEEGVKPADIKSENLVWLTESEEAAKEYGDVEQVDVADHRVVARDPQGGVLVELIKESAPGQTRTGTTAVEEQRSIQLTDEGKEKIAASDAAGKAALEKAVEETIAEVEKKKAPPLEKANAARAEKTLDRPVVVDGKKTTWRKQVDAAIAAGGRVEKKEDVLDVGGKRKAVDYQLYDSAGTDEWLSVPKAAFDYAERAQVEKPLSDERRAELEKVALRYKSEAEFIAAQVFETSEKETAKQLEGIWEAAKNKKDAIPKKEATKEKPKKKDATDKTDRFSVREDKELGFVVTEKKDEKSVVAGTFSNQEKAQQFIDEQQVVDEAEAKETAPTLPFTEEELKNDIPLDIAQAAHSGTSFSPEKRAESERATYAESITDMYEKLLKVAKSDAQKAKLDDLIQQFREKKKELYIKYLNAASRTMSTMVTGAGNFPFERNFKRMRIRDDRFSEAVAYNETFERIARKQLENIRIEEAGGEKAVADQEAAEMQERLDAMKEANKILRSKKLSEEEKIEQVSALPQHTEEMTKTLMEPDFAGRIGYPSFEITSLRNKIKARAVKSELIEKKEAAPDEDVELYTTDVARVAVNQHDDRVRIFFNEKPDEFVRQDLRSQGWKWSPKIKAWQRKVTHSAKMSAGRIVGKDTDKTSFQTVDENKAESTDDALMQDARKYKSAEEFVKAQKVNSQQLSTANPLTVYDIFDAGAELNKKVDAILRNGLQKLNKPKTTRFFEQNLIGRADLSSVGRYEKLIDQRVLDDIQFKKIKGLINEYQALKSRHAEAQYAKPDVVDTVKSSRLRDIVQKELELKYGKPSFVSESGSTYFDSADGVVRLSDHEIPQTASREYYEGMYGDKYARNIIIPSTVKYARDWNVRVVNEIRDILTDIYNRAHEAGKGDDALIRPERVSGSDQSMSGTAEGNIYGRGLYLQTVDENTVYLQNPTTGRMFGSVAVDKVLLVHPDSILVNSEDMENARTDLLAGRRSHSALPLLVRENIEEGFYELVDGNHRFLWKIAAENAQAIEVMTDEKEYRRLADLEERVGADFQLEMRRGGLANGATHAFNMARAKPANAQEQKAVIKEIGDRLGVEIPVTIVDTIYTGEAGGKFDGIDSREKARGAYTPIDNKIFLSKNDVADTTGFHETIHFVLNNIELFDTLKGFSLDSLYKAANNGKDYEPHEAHDLQEKIAVMAEQYYLGQKAKTPSVLARFFERVRIVLSRVLRHFGRDTNQINDFFRVLAYGRSQNWLAVRPRQSSTAELVYQKNNTGDVFIDMGLLESKAEQIAQKAQYTAMFQTLQDKKFSLAPEKNTEWFRRKVQDYNVRIESAQRQLIEQGAIIEESSDVFLHKTLLPRRLGALMEQFNKSVVKPFVQNMVADGIELEELDLYAHALHAPRRNEVMKERGYEDDNGSGLTNEEAAEILARFGKEGKAEKLKEYRDRMRKVQNIILDMQVKNGLRSQEEVDALREIFGDDYVPLAREMEEAESGITTGVTGKKGIDVRGKESRRAKGSERAVLPITAQVFSQFERALRRTEENRVFTALVNLIEANNQRGQLSDLFHVFKQQYVPRYDQYGEMQYLDPVLVSKPNVIGGKIGGKQVYVEIKDERFAAAMKASGVTRAFAPSAIFISYIARMITQYSPEFVLRNLQRDFFEGMINMREIKELKMSKEERKGVSRAIAKKVPGFIKSIYQFERDKKTKHDDLIKRFQQSGGEVGYFWSKNIEEVKIELDALVARYKGEGIEKVKEPIRAAGEFVDAANKAVELAFRVAVFDELTQRGLSNAKAAEIAGNITVDFNRMGELGPLMKSLYVFINPAVQGTARVIRATTSSKAVRRSIAAMVVGGFVNGVLSMMLGGDGDDDIDEYKKNTRIIIATPGGEQVTVFFLPYGYNSFWAFGRAMAEVTFGKITVGESLGRTVNAAFDSFNPLGGSHLTLSNLIPTAAKPLFEIEFNQGWWGGPISPEQPYFGAKVPDSQLYWNSVSNSALWVTSFLNKVTGGSETKSGFVDISPETLEYAIGQYTGSVGRFVSNTFETAATAVAGESPKKDHIPFVRDYYTTIDTARAKKQLIFPMLDEAGRKEYNEKEMERFYNALDTLVKLGEYTPSEASRFRTDFEESQHKVRTGESREMTAIKAGLVRMDDGASLSQVTKDILTEIHGEDYSSAQVTNTKKKIGVYRTFGFEDETVNELLSARSNDEKVQILIDLRRELGKEEFAKFFEKGRKKVTSSSGRDVPILISDALKDKYIERQDEL